MNRRRWGFEAVLQVRLASHDNIHSFYRISFYINLQRVLYVFSKNINDSVILGRNNYNNSKFFSF